MKPGPVLVLFLTIGGCVLGSTRSQSQEDTLKVTVDLVDVQFSVTDRNGRFVPGLAAGDFRVEEDGRRQEVRHFARENELPLTLGLLIDTSPSVRPVFDEERETAVAFLESILRPKDLALVIGFDRAVTLFQDFTEDVNSLRSAVDEMEIGGGTSLYDAVYLASEELDPEAGRKAIIVLSDGEDTTSRVTLNEALIAAHRSDSIIYAISNSSGGILGFGRRRRAPFGGGDIGTLRKFSDETGGRTFILNDQNGFKRIFDQIAQELRSQYSLGYVSTNPARDGKFRQIRIVPRDSRYSVRARKGYYAAKNSDIR